MLTCVLVVEDEVVLARNIQKYLECQDYEVHLSATIEDALSAAHRHKPDVILLDFKLPDSAGLEGLERLQEGNSEIPVIMMSGEGNIEVAVEAMKRGASDYLEKPIKLAELELVLRRVARTQHLEDALAYYHSEKGRGSGLAEIAGESEAMVNLRNRLSRIVESDSGLTSSTPPTVLITGETGTGKELAARAIHFDGPRAARPFVEINCAAIPEELLESELFGHERGAFTGAGRKKIGLAEAAQGGTLFLDEVGDLSTKLQTKLLRLLENRTMRRVGGVRDLSVDIRIVAATNQPLEQHVRDGKFRADVYYRLRVVELTVPPLRERRGDAQLLADLFLRQFAAKYGRKVQQLSRTARDELVSYEWRGNVRELKNTLEQSVLLTNPEAPEIETLGLRDRGTSDRRVLDPWEVELPAAGLVLEDLERSLVEQALERTEGNVSKAALLLGVSRDTLRYRIEKFAVPRSKTGRSAS